MDGEQQGEEKRTIQTKHAKNTNVSKRNYATFKN
jgi:hypothetical protein